MHTETRYLLNIGLRSSDGRCHITPGAAIHELYGALALSPVCVIKAHVAQSETEPTLVVELDAAPRWWSIFELANTLWQDCIACYDLTLEQGELVGPNAIKWGEFDPTQFLLPSGRTLEEPADLLYHVPNGVYAGQPFKNPQPLPLSADTADFSDFGDRNKLATLGIFSIDASWYKAKRAAEHANSLRIKGAYHWIGLSRHEEMTRIRSEVATLLGGSGIWPTSSGLYSDRMHALDAHVLRQAEKAGYAS